MDIKNLLTKLIESKGSDLLLASGNAPCLRVNNKMVKIQEASLTIQEMESLIEPIIRKEEMAKFKQEKELDTSYEDGQSRYRINLHYQMDGIGITIRRVPKDIPTLESLSLPSIVKSFTALERGLVLVTGPTGSGKSTTQAAMIDVINSTKPAHIITIEDPIEYVHKPKLSFIEQREVGVDTKSFGEALKRVLRQIPDVILIGEMRDLETMQMAVTAAETGHLVISTLHTQDAVQSIDRIIDVFPPHQQPQIRSQLSLTLQGIISQQLIPRKDGKGVAGAFGILLANPAIRNIIRKGSTQDIYSMVELGTQEGMQSMDSALKNLVIKGAISKEEAMGYAVNHERLEKLLSTI
ncbi:MAG: PilT/PilU family type 4a pilus ATPase [Candidatus Margulisiibacteriota bacterium]